MLVVKPIAVEIFHMRSSEKNQAWDDEKVFSLLFFVAIWVLVNWMMSLEGQKTVFVSLAFLSESIQAIVNLNSNILKTSKR